MRVVQITRFAQGRTPHLNPVPLLKGGPPYRLAPLQFYRQDVAI